MKTFQNASQAFKLANPHLRLIQAPKTNPGASSVGHRWIMNRTESEFALWLEAQKRTGEILRYEFEGITLRWADMRYTPDFIVFHHAYIKLIEVKGGHIWSRDIVRFKGARAYWPEFQFEMHQKTKAGWKRLH